jgi:hypothetical protein
MSVEPLNSFNRPLGKPLELRESLLLAFRDPVPAEFARLTHLSRSEWQRLLYWLDTSGLALYFLDRLEELNLLDILPSPVQARLERNRTDNAARMEEMIAECNAIQNRFQAAGLSYAVLKGFSLSPVSVPKLELRSQLDLDFLIAEANVNEARQILEEFGYQLNAISGSTWEFKDNTSQPSSIRDMYSAGTARSAELHVETPGSRPQLLKRAVGQCFHGTCMPVLSPVDLFIGQGLHLCKHVCSEFFRAAHLIEFRHHILARRYEDEFWRKLQAQTVDDAETRIRLGIVVGLITRVMGDFAPEALTSWTSSQLPPAVSQWIEVYGRRIAVTGFPGNKFYLLLQRELSSAGFRPRRSLREALLPLALPPLIAPRIAGESFTGRMNRYRKQTSFVLFRLRFHLTEGAFFLRESMRWRKYRNGLPE